VPLVEKLPELLLADRRLDRRHHANLASPDPDRNERGPSCVDVLAIEDRGTATMRRGVDQRSWEWNPPSVRIDNAPDAWL
jgi:hypothetical protein